MIDPARAARWTAIAIAVAAVIDPPIPLPRRLRPPVRVVAAAGAPEAARLSDALQQAGFVLTSSEPEAATVVVGDHLPEQALRAEHRAPNTQHRAPSTKHPAPSTEHPAPSTQHPAPSTEHPAPSTQHPAPSTEHQAPSTQHPAPSTPLWALDTTPPAPNVRIVSAAGPPVRLPGQGAEIRVTVDAQGVAGKVSELTLEDGGLPVASARHTWTRDPERWQASLQYLPPGAGGGRLHAKVNALPGETSLDDNAADAGVPPVRGPIRTLVLEAGVTWPALFVRRALEGEPAFAVAAVQHATRKIATRAGGPPAVLTRDALAPFEVALAGAPDNLTAAELDALRWFVEERGGVAVLIPDQHPVGRYLDLIGAPLLEPRALETPVALGPSLMAAEFLIAPRLPPAARTLGATGAGETVVFSARRGAGAVIFSGALDAWRYRARAEGDADGFARFWRRAIAEEATAVPPVLEVSVEPALVAVGGQARVRARLRATEFPSEISVTASRSPIPDLRAPEIDLDAVTARAISPGAHADDMVRLWPISEPGVYEGEWRPLVAGNYTISVTAGARAGDAPVVVLAGAAADRPPADPEGLALAARVSGGRVYPAPASAALVADMARTYPAQTVMRSSNPMRSPWWVVPFAGLLAVEWALRRRRGLA